MQVTVIYPVTFTVDDNELKGKDDEEIRELVKQKADNYLENGSVNPVIASCDKEWLVE